MFLHKIRLLHYKFLKCCSFAYVIIVSLISETGDDYHLEGNNMGETEEARVFNKSAQEIRVYAEKGNIVIEQPWFGHDDQNIWINPEQLDMVIQWLKEAKEALEK
jgi:hypothetical protein